MRSERYQIALISLGLVVTALFGYFLYREIFPEYRIYQNDYIALEEFRSTYTGEAPPEFKEGVKQIVFEREDKGPARVDRCITCHVATQLPHFSPTQIAHDVNGNIRRSADGKPLQEPNPYYIWGRLDQKIAALRDEKVNEQLINEGQGDKVKDRLKEAEELSALKIANVGDHTFDVTKVLSMHPLIGKETRPFEFHPLDDYGCTSCHSGNGRGLTTEKAHGPVFDGHYEAEYLGPRPQFLEYDPDNDPEFARVFNYKPGDALLFQTTPILVGNLIQGSCVQCHEQSAAALQGLAETAGVLAENRKNAFGAIAEGYKQEKEALVSLFELKKVVQKNEFDGALKILVQRLKNPALLPQERNYLNSQLAFLDKMKGQAPAQATQGAISAINGQLKEMLGSEKLVSAAEKILEGSEDSGLALDKFLQQEHGSAEAKGTLFVKWNTYHLEKALISHVEDTQQSLNNVVGDEATVEAMNSDLDWLTKNYKRGQQLYVSQACYACHRIAGFSRGGIGPELTREGEGYPWYIKNKLMWPQNDLKTSTMPNMLLDTMEIEDLMTYLMAQKGPGKAVSETDYKVAIQEWEAGRKMSWEKPIPPSQVHDLRYSMTVFATEGCAACHRLEGFQSNVGFRVEKEKKADFGEVYKERLWFKSMFPEEIRGSAIVKAIEEHAADIDAHIVDNVRKDSLLEEIEKKYPESIEALYSNFRYALRAKDHFSKTMAEKAVDESVRKEILAEHQAWKDRVHRVLMMYVQEYGLGRLIGPRPNWSGVYRSDEWLMEHFHNPAGHVPRSIMPILPFDDSKFYALTYMLDVLGKRNRDAVRAIWQYKGFDPEQAFQIHCSQCHGEYLQGNGPVSTWIYPIPKNLRNAEFLRNLTKENAIQSIRHGVKGTPMPPWGETPRDKETYDGIPVLTFEEISKLVNWLYTSIPGGTVIRGHEDVPKWNYTPKDVLEELHREGTELVPGEPYLPHESGGVNGNEKTDVGAKDAWPPFHFVADAGLTAPSIEAKPEDVFEVTLNTIPGGEKYAYYIKKKYYTEENVENGKRFFEINCAACHGADADGSGIRASVMIDAKPRMLTNLDWINTRDDLRLLRSIKYGVPGTAMTPWGDFTSSLQRMQLVMFIRSLSFEKEARENLAEALYKAFDQAAFQLENVRISEYTHLSGAQNEYEEVQKQQKAAFKEAQHDPKAYQAAVDLYKKQLEAAEALRKYQDKDQLMVELRKQIAKERDVYQNIGNQLLSAKLENEPLWQSFLKLIALNDHRFSFEGNKIYLNSVPNKEQAALVKQIVGAIDVKIDSLEKAKMGVQGNLPTNIELHSISAQIATYNKIKSSILSGMEEMAVIHKEQQRLSQRKDE